MRVLWVKWQDAAYFRDLPADTPACMVSMETIGWELPSSDDSLAIAHERCEDGSYRSVTAIPLAWIQKVTDLTVAPTTEEA